MSERRFSIVVVIHDSEPHLRGLLASIDRHLCSRPEVIVVDTQSVDDGPSIATAWGAELVTLPGNPGFGAANNAGVARCSADVCVLVNPDIELLDGGLAALAGLARQREALLVPRLLETTGRVQRSAHPLPGRAEALLPAALHPRLLPHALRLRADPWRADEPREVGWAIAACVAARTETLTRLARSIPRCSCSSRTWSCACAPGPPACQPSCARRSPCATWVAIRPVSGIAGSPTCCWLGGVAR